MKREIIKPKAGRGEIRENTGLMRFLLTIDESPETNRLHQLPVSEDDPGHAGIFGCEDASYLHISYVLQDISGHEPMTAAVTGVPPIKKEPRSRYVIPFASRSANTSFAAAMPFRAAGKPA